MATWNKKNIDEGLSSPSGILNVQRRVKRLVQHLDMLGGYIRKDVLDSINEIGFKATMELPKYKAERAKFTTNLKASGRLSTEGIEPFFLQKGAKYEPDETNDPDETGNNSIMDSKGIFFPLEKIRNFENLTKVGGDVRFSTDHKEIGVLIALIVAEQGLKTAKEIEDFILNNDVTKIAKRIQTAKVKNLETFETAKEQNPNKIKTCAKTAELILKKIRFGAVEYHHNSDAVNKIRAGAQSLDSSIQADKWNPADIYLFAKNFNINKFLNVLTKQQTFDKFNEVFNRAVLDHQIFPISLKESASDPTGSLSIEKVAPFPGQRPWNEKTLQETVKEMRTLEQQVKSLKNAYGKPLKFQVTVRQQGDEPIYKDLKEFLENKNEKNIHAWLWTYPPVIIWLNDVLKDQGVETIESALKLAHSISEISSVYYVANNDYCSIENVDQTFLTLLGVYPVVSTSSLWFHYEVANTQKAEYIAEIRSKKSIPNFNTYKDTSKLRQGYPIKL